jgi:hypothetical protein
MQKIITTKPAKKKKESIVHANYEGPITKAKKKNKKSIAKKQ